MTVRLYYQDPYSFHFRARVLSCRPEMEAFAVELDRTCFYPEGGGQPWDTGTLDGVRVLAVHERDDRVVHIVEGPIASSEVEGIVDEARRRDHMEHHTGQHLLSAAFIEVLSAPTVSMHIGEAEATIDLERAELSEEDADRVEELVNRVIREDRPIRCFYPSLDELKELPLRKVPQVEENIRIVRVDRFDASPCGGTHCPSTGRVGLIKLRRWERYKGKTRVTFLCGGRALADYRWKNRAVNRIAEKFSIKDREVDNRVLAMAEEHVELGRAYRRLKLELLGHEAGPLRSVAPRLSDGTPVVVRRLAEGAGAEDLKALAEAIVKERAIALLGAASAGKGTLFFSRSADLQADMSALLRSVVGRLGGKGGGSAQLAQGGVPAEKLDEALEEARRALE